MMMMMMMSYSGIFPSLQAKITHLNVINLFYLNERENNGSNHATNPKKVQQRISVLDYGYLQQTTLCSLPAVDTAFIHCFFQ